MTNSVWYPYAPDQDFGVRVAADEAFLDRLIASLDTARRSAPRPGNKAAVTNDAGLVPGQPPLPPALADAWLRLATTGDGLNGPVTTAVALDAAAQIRVAER
jgi:hypothetical protein